MLFLLLCLCLLHVHQSDAKLKSIFVIHRHGDRTPIMTYPTDPYKCHWTQGYGVVTERGLRRMNDFGKILRRRYGNFWPKKSEIFMRSSDSDRVIKSAMSLLDGIYADKFLLNPIPIMIEPKEIDGMLSQDSECPKYIAEVARIYELPETVEWFNSLTPLWSYLSEKTKWPITKLDANNRLHAGAYWDILAAQKQFNLSFPEWMNETLFEKLRAVAFHNLYLTYSTPLTQRLRAGLLFEEIRNQMEAIRNGTKYNKVRIYSTHDIQMAGMMITLDSYVGPPPYGSSIVFEFHSTPSNEYFINGLFLNDTSTAIFHPLKMKGCHEHLGCSFANFNKIIDSLILDDWSKECQL